MSTFVSSGSSVVYTDDAGRVFSLPSSMIVYPHPTDADLIVISTQITLDVIGDDELVVSQSAVSSPSSVSVSDLITQLNSSFFTGNTVSGGGDASAANQSLQIAEAQTTNAELKKLPYDAAGSLQVSQRKVLASLVQSHGDLPRFYSRRNIGTANQSHNKNKVNMTVATTSDVAVAQTFQFYPYFAGKPVRSEFTVIDFDTETDVEKGFGQYHNIDFTSPYNTTLDGFRLWDDGTTKRFQVFNNGTTVADIPQASWDDPMDGNGPSGVTIDFAKFNIYIFDYLWLGGSGVRFFMNVGDDIILVHTYKHSNTSTDTIFQKPEHPARFEIRSTGGAGNMKQVCAAVSIDTFTPDTGHNVGVDVGTTFLNANVVGTAYAALGVRIDPNEYNASVAIDTISALAATADAFILQVRHNPTVAGTAPVWNFVADSDIDYAIGDTTNTVTGGDILYSSFVQTNGETLGDINGLLKLGTDLDGTPDEQWIVIIPLGANLDVYTGINLKEV